jgi:hypothetical protein
VSPVFRNAKSSASVGAYEQNHRLGINRPTKGGEEKCSSDGHCQCQKEMDDHLLVCQQFLTESHIVTRLPNERASFLNVNDINDIFWNI